MTSSNMTNPTQPLDPQECRRRAQRLRERAQSSTLVDAELREAADTWDELARHAEALQDAFRDLHANGGRKR
jgi:hypothetical protein